MSLRNDLDALAGLEPVALDELMASAELQVRHDRKYLVPTGLVGDLVADLIAGAGAGAGSRVLTIDGAHCFRYRSVYFDTVDLASYLSAARRRPRRFKVRTRSYLDSGDCLLEVKTRDARGRTIKHRHPYDIEHQAQLTDDGRRFVSTVDQAAATADVLQPTLTTGYRRATLLLPGARARVTIDIDLTWSHPGSPAHHLDLAGLAIVETKTPGPPCPFDRALWSAGRRPVTISKYCTGLAALTPHLPANKWHRVLRRHFDRSPTAGDPTP
jgi:hypothetical protein